MSRVFKAASAVAVSMTAFMAIALTVPGLAQNTPGDVVFESSPVVQPISTIANADAVVADQPVAEAAVVEGAVIDRESDATTLAAMVSEFAGSEADNAEQRCLAIGIYYESRSESLEGQLAVANVILNRTESGRFSDSVCGVLTQPRQFSFVRGGVLRAPRDSQQWRTAVGVARVAMAEEWASPVPGALFFHATHVSPGWGRPRVARLGNHVFYR
jgi:spore germination cell wall hydrolase CwlJ-like protein